MGDSKKNVDITSPGEMGLYEPTNMRMSTRKSKEKGQQSCFFTNNLAMLQPALDCK